MSSAHRPTWDPAQGKDTRGNSRIYSVRDLAAHTRLKFRQPGQGTTSEVQRRDLKLELLQAERDSAARKAKGRSGLVVDESLLLLENAKKQEEAETEEAKRRKLLLAQVNLDADDDDDDADDGEDDAVSLGGDGSDNERTTIDRKGKGKAADTIADRGQADSDDDEDSSDDDDEDETAELLRELEKIKRERAEEKEKLERERAANEAVSREAEIATGNPLLNLQAALGYQASPTPSSTGSTATSSFGVKRRWDDDVIFKNQARDVKETPKNEFVNDLLRTNYHRKFLSRFVQ